VFKFWEKITLKVVQSEMCSARTRPRRDVALASAPCRGPPPPQRPVPPARVPKAARAFPRSRLSSRCLERRERLVPVPPYASCHGPLVRSRSLCQARVPETLALAPASVVVGAAWGRSLRLKSRPALAGRREAAPHALRQQRRRSFNPAWLRRNQLTPHLHKPSRNYPAARSLP
jgi:hypothetical protein